MIVLIICYFEKIKELTYEFLMACIYSLDQSKLINFLLTS
jgi:hypothetical protein